MATMTRPAATYQLLERLDQPSSYRDRQSSQRADLATSTTLYVGNLSFYTTEEQIHELFAKCGEIKRIIMGLDRNTKSPCGFCFVEYYNHSDAADCMMFVSGTKLDDRLIRCDLDPGYREGRQWGRGRSGGQVRDEYREDWDNGRGGWGKRAQEARQKEHENKATYAVGDNIAPLGASNTFEDRFRED
ncbi:hypothetical protein BCR37DRAFT_377977 [Protomyces lactucae-debilis]|uniref:Nuclear cap-binding protein subunit 2 n=1 Tax=Protomyces lactucae-debilis TaxID=2754530 RepID=A0A1Y2FLZ8_PROLT|nr:uncharacterized protein BCR37DRAFT_377977 [Protomyces lactucae-debilis]ORY85002.1 hypothetical protein BCR37DRAFT_377977 [Protomyces lactucae-debilis]